MSASTLPRMNVRCENPACNGEGMVVIKERFGPSILFPEKPVP